MPRGKVTASDVEIILAWKAGAFKREIQKKLHVGIIRLRRVIRNAEN
jgi:hypothetical protein